MLCLKRSYPNKRTASFDAKRIHEESLEYCRPYRCSKCRKWHVTSKSKSRKGISYKNIPDIEVEDINKYTGNELDNKPFALLLK